MENTTTPEETVRLLEGKLRPAKGQLTVSDAAAATGLPVVHMQEALAVLMNRYVCRLRVTEHGEVLYDFGSSLRRRGEKTFREKLQTVRTWLWKAFTVGFKVWITVMLVLYFIVFVLLLLALVFSGRDSKKSIKLDWIGDLFADIFWISSRNMVIVRTMDGAGYSHKAYRQRQRRSEGVEPKKRLVQSVYDFVFGPPRPNYDPFANEKEVAAWLREHRAVLTMTDLVALAGWTYDQASERMADYLTRFRGEATITDDGVLIGDFQQMLATGSTQIESGKVELFWDEYEAPYEMTGNTSGRNAAIVAVNAFNLIFSTVILFSSGMRAQLEILLYEFGIGGGFLLFALGIIPFLFSLLFFAVPILRLPSTRRLEAARKKRNEHRRVLRHIFARKGGAVSLADLLADVNGDGSRAMTEADVRRIVEELIPIYGGQSDLSEDGSVVYIFDRIGREEEAASSARIERSGTEVLGTVIFDTGSPSA
jgi:hypothetical protein